MPIFDFGCLSCQRRSERFLHRRENPNPECEHCGSPATVRLISRFAAIWTKSLSDYGDSRKETYHKDAKNGGHWVARKRSGGGTEEAPKYEFLETHQAQKNYCREEGLLNPDEVGNISIKSDGEGCTTQGLPGSWV